MSQNGREWEDTYIVDPFDAHDLVHKRYFCDLVDVLSKRAIVATIGVAEDVDISM
jgi:hypothetical protein